jgi:murein DD-endopeptidase MepM/ murein hydrolase activator NlpD
VTRPRPPAARDPRMERPAEPDPGATLLMVPHRSTEAVHVVDLGGGRASGWGRVSAGLATVVVLMGIIVAMAWPRARAYGPLVDENLELKRRLVAVDRKMSEVDRILLRLRLYDAQLESLGGPTGDHGPLPEEAFANDSVSVAFREEPEHEPLGEAGLRPAESWAAGVEARADTLERLFSTVEPELNDLVGELEALEALERALPSFWPADGVLTSGFGWRRNPLGFRWKHHSGIDLAGDPGDPVWAAAPGTVLESGWNAGYGRVVVIDHGYGITTLYAHQTRLMVQEGQEVRRGQQIGTVGNTGRSTGPHLHFEVRLDGNAVDPLDYLGSRRRRGGSWRTAPGD